jgi:hypothetical protein
MTWAFALYAAKTPYVALLNDDDWHEPTFVERCEQQLENPDIAYCFTNALIHDGEKTFLNLPENFPSGIYKAEVIEKMLLEMPLTVSPACVVFRRENVGRDLITNQLPVPYPPPAMVGNDTLLLLLPLLRYKHVAFINEPLANFRLHAGSYTIDALADAKKSAELHRHYRVAKDWYLAQKRYGNA